MSVDLLLDPVEELSQAMQRESHKNYSFFVFPQSDSDVVCSVLTAGEPYQIKAFQMFAHKDPENTYTINFVTADNETVTLLQKNQTSTNETLDGVVLTFDVTLPDTPETGYIQLVFDATPGGSSVYYSCADVVLQGTAETTTSAETSSTEVT